MKWLEIAVSTQPEGVDLISNIFEEMGAGGVLIEDPALIYRYVSEGTPDTVVPELTVPDITRVKAYLPVDESLNERLIRLDKSLSILPMETTPEYQTRELEEADWANAWKAYYKPVKIGNRLVVKPSWEEYTPVEGEVILEMDPGMAFGCGTHPTTTMCLRFLEEHIQGGRTVFDVGTGSGILAVAAAKLGARLVVAVDLDNVAVRVARENIERNGVTDIVKVRSGNLLDMVSGRADVVVANIIADVIIKMAHDAYKVLTPGGVLIASGIIEFRQHDVRKTLERVGFFVQELRREGEWIALLAIKETKE